MSRNANARSAPPPVQRPSASGPSWTVALPTDLLDQSCRRVGIAALVFAGVWVLTTILNAFLYPIPGYPWPGNAIAAVAVTLSIGMAIAAARLQVRPQLLLDLGLAFMVVHAMLAGMLQYWDPTMLVGVETRVSWLVVIILVYPSIAPNTPRKILVASLLAASMDPLGLALSLARGSTIPIHAPTLINWFLPNYLAAFLAVLPVHIIGRLSRQIRQARALGNYQLEEVLGQGGMGEVHRATHRLLARPAAVKLIRPEMLTGGPSSGILIERFKREAQAAAELRSPHTIELYDFGIAQDGTFYYVMELLDGLDLETLVKRFGPVPAERARHLMRQACLSLGEAHQHGLIHRDVKPSNVFTSRLGLQVDFVKVLDFGLVKAIASRAEAKLTAPNIATGTPAFMAPEVALGEDANAAADVYSLGAVLYWLLTAQLVYEADTPIQMMYRHIEGDPMPPSQRTELPIPPELDALVLSCLAKDPAKRPADGSALAQALDEMQFERVWTDERARRWWAANYPTGQTGEVCEPIVLAPALQP